MASGKKGGYGCAGVIVAIIVIAVLRWASSIRIDEPFKFVLSLVGIIVVCLVLTVLGEWAKK